MFVRTLQGVPERDEQDASFSSSLANPGPRATVIPGPAARLTPNRTNAPCGTPLPIRQKDQLPETDPDDGGQAHQSVIERKGFPSHPTGYGAEASIQKAMNLLALCPGQDPSSASQRQSDPSGPVFSSHCHQNRRPDPMVTAAKPCLSSWIGIPHVSRHSREGMVELVGIEPTTPCLQSRCSPS